jgi:hypothetical protein
MTELNIPTPVKVNSASLNRRQEVDKASGLKEIGRGDSYLLGCANCGKQNLMLYDDPYDAKCEFGNHPVRIKKEERNMNSETGNEEEIKKIITDASAPPSPGVLSTIPPKPDVSGLKRITGDKVVHKYYEANAPAIKAEFASIGSQPTRLRWGFSLSAWQRFRKEHGLPIEHRKKNTAVPDGNPPATRGEKPIISEKKAAQIEKMRAARGKKCHSCEHGYPFEGELYCSEKKCLFRLPVDLRAPYRSQLQLVAQSPQVTKRINIFRRVLKIFGGGAAPLRRGKVNIPDTPCEDCELFIEYRGYTKAIKDLGGCPGRTVKK